MDIARVLHENHLAARPASIPVSAFYGSDDLWIWSSTIISDQMFNVACGVLIANGFEAAAKRSFDYKCFQPQENSDGTETVK